MKLYFAYGANLSKDSMAFRCPGAVPFSKFELHDWALDFNTHATIKPKKGARVQGALWRITDECEFNLDIFEGYPHYYDKRTLEQDGLEFMVYVMNEPDYKASPSGGYISLIQQGYQDWHLDENRLFRAVDQKYDMC